ncbi:MAG TPA: BON domain-containing protein [Longimicrobium sp.]|nr:BON domain-containing protein [Longimicrobium sp.]
MKTPSELQRDVMDELEFDPRFDASGIGVAVSDGGVVTLTGHVESYAAKVATENAVKRVKGVKGVANDLSVRLWAGTERDDTDIAHAAVNALAWNTWLPRDAVTVTVKNGWVTLEGSLDWQYQREDARATVAHLTGVKGVTNLTTVKATVAPAAVENSVKSAFQRSASIDANHVHVETIGGRVILRGKVRSWVERDDAERAAWSVAGVTQVDNDLSIGVTEYAGI